MPTFQNMAKYNGTPEIRPMNTDSLKLREQVSQEGGIPIGLKQRFVTIYSNGGLVFLGSLQGNSMNPQRVVKKNDLIFQPPGPESNEPFSGEKLKKNKRSSVHARGRNI